LSRASRTLTLILLALCLSAAALHAQNNGGFIDSLTRANAGNVFVDWRESWFSGIWYNFSFVDNFAFTYRFNGASSPPPAEQIINVDAFNAAMGDFGTGYLGPKFALLGYVEEDSMWCIIPAVLSPDYIQQIQGPDSTTEYRISRTWYSWCEFWERPPGGHPTYLYEETYVEHNLVMWARLLPHKTIKVYWGVDAFGGWDSYRVGNLISARNICVLSSTIGDAPTYYDDWTEYMQAESGVWHLLGEYNIDGPEPPPGFDPPGWAECTFIDWVLPGGGTGENWLPTPGCEIGLKFKYKRDDNPASATIRYNIFMISTWQGECMNYPVNAPQPIPTGAGEYFDFSIRDTADYNITIWDEDFPQDYDGKGKVGWASMRRMMAEKEIDFPLGQTEVYDVLWLKAHDYGAKCIVSPSTGQTWRDLMKLRTTAFGQDVWTVSVPRDDDGQAFTGYNWGDFMADYWEETVLGLSPVPSSDSAVVNFTPFYQLDTHYSPIYADLDLEPAGRNIVGDGFCNWEEYRGFITVGDQNGFYPASNPYQHKRLDPKIKNVMVHFMPNAECLPEAPGWINSLPNQMSYLVDHLTTLTDTDSCRLSLVRQVNINRLGAYYPYYASETFWSSLSSFKTTNQPANIEGQNAVVFWSEYRGNNRALMPSNPNSLGYVKPVWRFSNDLAATIPRFTRQVVVRSDVIDTWVVNLPFYNGNLDSFLVDTDKLKRMVIAHELGHTIGMSHDPSIMLQYLMAEHPSTDPNNQLKLILDPPLFTRQYSDTSKTKISILREETR